ncbi:MAG TPA: translocation/assembly module TamB domain-containing protein [Terracidiphilus sp.]|nr:translocation/assembly module TamB domain-containing protein [Terracidiphilus sp.]
MSETEEVTGSADQGPQKNSRRWLRVLAWTAGCLVCLVIAAGAGITVLVNSDGVHRYLIEKAESAASARLGVRVRLENFAVHLATLSVDLYGISVDGSDPYAKPELLQVDHVQIGARIISVLARKWYLTSVQVDHPVVWITINENGKSNLPKLKSSGGGSGTSIFDLAIRHAVLDRGEVYFNSRPSALTADVRNLDFHAAFNTLFVQYSGKLAYTNAHVQYGGMRPIVHDLDVSFDATPSAFHLTQAKISSGASQVLLSATLKNYAKPEVQGQYEATIDGKQLGAILKSASVPAGLMRAAGTVRYEQATDRPWLQSLTLDGDLTSRRLDVRTSAARGAIENAIAHYSLANGEVTLRDLRAGLLGGTLTAKGTIKNVGGDSRANVIAALRGVSMARLRQAFPRANARSDLSLTGTLDATAKASWGKTLDDLTAQMDAAAHGQMARVSAAQKAAANESAIPVESAIHGTYNAANRQFALKDSYVRTTQTDVNLNGVVGRQSSIAMNVEAKDLSEVADIAELFRVAKPGQTQQPIDLSGEASFAGKVDGTIAAPHLTGALQATNVRVNGTQWKTVRTDVDLSPSHAGLEHASFESASGAHIGLSAGTELNDWSFTPQSPVDVQLNVTRMQLAEIVKLAEQQIPVTGLLNANFTLHGNAKSPQGNGHVSLTSVTAYDEPIQTVNVSFSGDGNTVHADIAAKLAAGEIAGKATVQPWEKTYAAQLSSTGIDLSKLHAVEARGADVSGVIALNANGQGSFDNPQAEASLEIPKLTMEDQTVSAVKLRASVTDHVARATLTSSALGTAINGKATVELSGDYLADASLDTAAFPLQQMLAVYAPDEAEDVSGQVEVHATLHGPLKNKNLLEAHATVPLLKVGYSNTVELAAAAPIQMDYKNGVVTLQPAEIRGTDTDLKMQASIPVSGNAPASLVAQGTVNLHLLQLFNPDLRSSGELRLNINSRGVLSAKNLAGEIDVVDANLASMTLPVGLQRGNGKLTLTADRLNVDQFEGTMGGGTVTAQGGVAFKPRLQFNLGASAQGVRMLYPQGMRESVSATVRLTGTFNRAALGGTVNVSDLSFTPDFDLTDFIHQFSGGVVAPPRRGFAQNLTLNVVVHSTNNVNLVSRTLSVGGTANLQVRGTAAQPVILGRINLSGGDIIANGNRFVLTGGTVQFVNPSETEPVVNLSLNTSIQQYNIHLRFNGPVEQLRSEYSSDPALPTADIINLLAFGSTTEASAANPVNMNQQAESLVASQVSSQVTSRVSKAAGISQLSISPVLAGSGAQGPAGANITIQQRVTGNLFVTFSTNVSSTQGQTIQGQYKVSPRVSLSATRDPNGGFAVDALIKKSW